MSTNHNLLKRKESRSGIEPRSFCLPVTETPFNARPNRITSDGTDTGQTPGTGLRHPSFGGRCRKAMLGVSVDTGVRLPPPPPPPISCDLDQSPLSSCDLSGHNSALNESTEQSRQTRLDQQRRTRLCVLSVDYTLIPLYASSSITKTTQA